MEPYDLTSVYTNRPLRLGDVIHLILKRIGIRPFKGCRCDKYRQFLNRFPAPGFRWLAARPPRSAEKKPEKTGNPILPL